MKAAAIYRRVSSEQQKEENTIASQTEALVEFARGQLAASAQPGPAPRRGHIGALSGRSVTSRARGQFGASVESSNNGGRALLFAFVDREDARKTSASRLATQGETTPPTPSGRAPAKTGAAHAPARRRCGHE
jgi:hypothetical protein